MQKPSRSDAQDRQALLNYLSTHRGLKFRAAQLEEATGISKSRLRGLLAALPEVAITTAETMRIPERESKSGGDKRESTVYWYQWRKQ